LSPLITHRLPELFANPELFDPMRFAPPREEHKRSSFGLIAFGAGIHKCLGYELANLEIKIILLLLLQMNWKMTNSFQDFASVPNNYNLPKLRFMITD
jgi:cytochrome P450